MGDVASGRFYRRADDGQLHEVGPGQPDRHICRRVSDFPKSLPPPGGIIGVCGECGAWIVHDGRFGSVRRVCMQCAGIKPLPLDVVNTMDGSR